MIVIHDASVIQSLLFFYPRIFAWAAWLEFELMMSYMVMMVSQETEGRWMWKKPPPASRKQGDGGGTVVRKIQRHKQILSAKERLLNGIVFVWSLFLIFPTILPTLDLL